ncbi:MAG: PHP domain-containing protein [Fretibacterium sp.]|nr:PHP domain-containing protein [Fretibacterium sp.]
MIRINLHLHSTSSDGVFSPAELVRMLRKNKVSIASLTDHDTTEGVRSFLDSCRRHSLRGVAGVELSSLHQGEELHILGYRFDLDHPELNDLLTACRNARCERNKAMCERLTSLGFPVSLEEVEARVPVGVAGRPHIAQVMREKGFVPTEQEAFLRWLRRGRPAFVPRVLLPAESCIEVLRRAGGLPVWAHPLTSLSDPSELEPTLDRLKEAGLWGLECWFPGATSAVTYRCLVEAGKRGLYQTAGTDFHGRAGRGERISGCVVEDDLLPWAWFCGGRG